MGGVDRPYGDRLGANTVGRLIGPMVTGWELTLWGG